MDREEIRGRASLSFPATQGILDMDQILQTDPWNQIDDFVQCNFMQDVLNEFNDRMALDPKHAPADNKSSTDKRPTPSSRGTRKSQTGQTNEGKKRAGKVGVPKSKEHKTDIAPKSESSRTKASNRNEEKERVKTSNENGEKLGTVRKPAANRKMLGNSLKMRCKKQSTPTPVKQNEEEVANVSTRSDKNMVDANSENENSINTRTPRSRNSKLPLKASTPMCQLSKISDSLGKDCAIEKNNVTAVRKKFSATRDASIKKSDKRRKCATRDLNNNCNKLEPAEKVNKNAAVTCKNEAATARKITEKKRAPTSRQSETSKCNVLRDRKLARAGKKMVGKFEQRLLDKRERRNERKTSRHERKAERAMEKFSHHVTRIVRKMGYLPEYSSSTSSCSGDSDGCRDSTDESSYTGFTDESSYSDSTDDSSYSDSCCSNSSCSCCTSCSNSSEYTEYSPCSSSN